VTDGDHEHEELGVEFAVKGLAAPRPGASVKAVMMCMA